MAVNHATNEDKYDDKKQQKSKLKSMTCTSCGEGGEVTSVEGEAATRRLGRKLNLDGEGGSVLLGSINVRLTLRKC